MSALTVIQPGPRTTIQDLGRTGYQHQGLSPGGAADLRSFRWANQLLGNAANDACLEITMGSFDAAAQQPVVLAITGADCRATVNGTPVGHWGVFAMNPGDRLRLGTPRSGLLTYLAVAGGWQTRSFCGSRSCVVREGLHDLGAVAPGTGLSTTRPLPERDLRKNLERTVPIRLRPDLDSRVPLKLMPGPECHTFTDLDRARFIHSRYTVNQHSDRMGYRLDGPALQSTGGIHSKGVCCGTVQVPGDGKPMVLLNDCQTIGGYPVMGTLPRLDCSRLAQIRPGQQVRFQWTDVAACQSERLLFERMLNVMFRS